ncbi:N-acetyltransferase family protein [Streptomyces sp. NPDC001770]
MLEFQALGPDDWRTWRELRHAALSEAPHAFGSTLVEWQGLGDREERWRARLDIPDSHNVVAHLDGRPAGMVSGVPADEADVFELISMWVAPAARGRGVGGGLIHEVVRWAALRHAHTLRLSVRPGNRDALALYGRHGFGSGRGRGGPTERLPAGPLGEESELRLSKPLGADPGGAAGTCGSC